MNRQILCFVTLLGLIQPVWSQDAIDPAPEAVPPPPDIPDPIRSGEPIEPEVTIIQKKDSTIEEYRMNGNLYMVKVTPAVGAPYYLMDRDGDGMMEFRSSKLGNDMVVPQWVLFEW
jgi:hypothetical protein